LQIAERAKKIEPSATLSISARAAALKKEGKDVISFSAGEPDFDTPLVIKKRPKGLLMRVLPNILLLLEHRS